MIVDAELAAAVHGRPHWRIGGDTAVYAPPGSESVVRVRPLGSSPSGRDRYHAAVIRNGAAQASVTERSAGAAVGWSERRQLA